MTDVVDYTRAALLLKVAEGSLKYPPLKALHDLVLVDLTGMAAVAQKALDDLAKKKAADDAAATQKRLADSQRAAGEAARQAATQRPTLTPTPAPEPTPIVPDQEPEPANPTIE